MKPFAVRIDRAFVPAVYSPDHLSARVRPSRTLRPNDQYWNLYLDRLFDLWYAGLDTSQIALGCGVTEAEAYNVMASSWDWASEDRRKAHTLSARYLE